MNDKYRLEDVSDLNARDTDGPHSLEHQPSDLLSLDQTLEEFAKVRQACLCMLLRYTCNVIQKISNAIEAHSLGKVY